MGIVRVVAVRCERCGHIWLPGGGTDRVKSCSKCKSKLWNITPKEPIRRRYRSRTRNLWEPVGKRIP